jgi:hypothetical protein
MHINFSKFETKLGQTLGLISQVQQQDQKDKSMCKWLNILKRIRNIINY